MDLVLNNPDRVTNPDRFEEQYFRVEDVRHADQHLVSSLLVARPIISPVETIIFLPFHRIDEAEHAERVKARLDLVEVY